MNEISIALGGILILIGLYTIFHGVWNTRIMGILFLVYAVHFAFLLGSTTSLALPGLGSVAIGAGTGGAIGLGASILLGTLGIATGGVAFGLGALGMMAIGSLVGGLGAFSGGFGLKTSYHFMVTPLFWVPLILLALWMILRPRRAK